MQNRVGRREQGIENLGSRRRKAVFSLSLVAMFLSCQAAAETINLNSIYNVPVQKKSYACVPSRNKFVHVKLVAGKAQLASKLIKSLKAKMSRASGNQKTKLAKQLAQLAKGAKVCAAGPKTPVALAITVAVTEAQPTAFMLQATDPYGIPLTFAVQTSPTSGQLRGSGPELLYDPQGHSLLDQSFTFTVSNGFKTSAPAQVTLDIQSAAGDFAGQAFSLRPYRDQLSKREVLHLLRKSTFGPTSTFISIGTSQGLDALLDALVNDSTNADAVADPLRFNSSNHWVTDSNTSGVRPYFLMHAAQGATLREFWAFLWSYHFGVNTTQFDDTSNRHQYIGAYVDLMRANALGNFEVFVHDIARDGAMNNWLDNRLNKVGNLNQNYARELQELFTLGTVDPVTGAANYDSRSIVAATDAVTGFREVTDASGVNSILPNIVPGRHVFGLKTMYPDTPYEGTADFDHDSLVSHILYQHDGSARYIGAKLFSQIVHADPNEAVVAELANDLRSGNYALAPVILKIMRSSAMFSSQAQHACVMGPFNNIVHLIRALGLPLSSQALRAAALDYAANAGQSPFQPPTVFGFKEACGVNRDGEHNVGQGWVFNSQLLLERARGLNNFLGQLQSAGFNWNSLRPAPNAPAQEIVAHLAELLGVDSPGVRQRVLDYMNSTRVVTGGVVTYNVTPFSSASASNQRNKIAGAVAILASVMQGQTA